MRGRVPFRHGPAQVADEPHVLTRAVPGDQNARRAVRLVDLFQFVGHVADSLVPADALPFVDAAQLFLTAARLPVLALERILDTVGAEDVLLLAAPAQASPDLRELDAVLMRVVGFLPHDHAVFHQHLVEAPAAAIVPARGGNPRAFGQRRLLDAVRRRVLDRLDLVRATCQARNRQRGRCRSARFDEPSTTHLRRTPRLLQIARHLSSFASHPLRTALFGLDISIRTAFVNCHVPVLETFLPGSFQILNGRGGAPASFPLQCRTLRAPRP